MEEKCSICLSPLGKPTVGWLETCQHVFCLQCILQWSQTANTCPVDRIRFDFIHQRLFPGGDVQRKIEVKEQRIDAIDDDDDDDDEEESSPVICEECGRSDRRHRLLLCMLCESGYHTDCLTPALNTDHEADWICSDCDNNPHQTGISAMEEEISGEEITHLLAEVGEAASPGSRLRTSTVNRPISSAQRRKSLRIQSRSRRLSSSLRPRTPLRVPKYLIQSSRSAPGGST